MAGFPFQINGDHLGPLDIVGMAQELLHQFRTSFPDGHGAEGPVPGVAVGPQDHLPAAGHPFPHVFMDDGHMGRYIKAPEPLHRRQAEDMVVLVDGAPYGGQAVVAVGQDVGNGEMVQAAGNGRLDDPHIGDVMAGKSIELQMEVFHPAALLVGFHHLIGQGLLHPFRPVGFNPLGSQFLLRQQLSVSVIYILVDQFNHLCSPPKFRFNCAQPYHRIICEITQIRVYLYQPSNYSMAIATEQQRRTADSPRPSFSVAGFQEATLSFEICPLSPLSFSVYLFPT